MSHAIAIIVLSSVLVGLVALTLVKEGRWVPAAVLGVAWTLLAFSEDVLKSVAPV